MGSTVDIKFNVLNEIVLDALETNEYPIPNNTLLTILGDWFYAFLNGEQKHLELFIPQYDDSIIESSIAYIYFFDLLNKIIRLDKADDLTGASLFDVFEYKRQRRNEKIKDLFLAFKKTYDQSLYFGNNTVVSKSRFLPLFRTTNLSDLEKNAIYHSFILFNSISKSGVINYPIIIDTADNISLLFSKRSLFVSPKLQFIGLVDDDPDLTKIYDTLDNLKEQKNRIGECIFFKYPYHSHIDSRLFTEVEDIPKIFEVNFTSRFSIAEVQDFQQYLIPTELHGQRIDFNLMHRDIFEIIYTNNNLEILENFRELKDYWRNNKFNVYKTPNPSLWLMCIHHGERLDYWINQYKNDFNEVLNHPYILRLIESTIKLLYELNWIDNYLVKNIKASLLLPSSKLLRNVTISLKNYLDKDFKNIKYFVTPLDEDIKLEKDIIILDPFNTKALANVFFLPNIKVLVPDFIYFNVQPYIKYFIAKKLFDALTLGSRKYFDPNYEINKEEWKISRNAIFNKLKIEQKTYFYRYSIGLTDIKENEIENEIVNSFDDIIEEEVIQLQIEKERTKLKENNNCKSVLITTTESKEILLSPGSKILIEDKGFIIESKAKLLEVGDIFFPLADMPKYVNKEWLANKMATIPKDARFWQNSLYKKSLDIINLYSILKNKGLSISESHFKMHYLDERTSFEEFHLTRSKGDWKIICDILSIAGYEETWRIHRCKGDINKLKKAYIEIISYLVTESNNGYNFEDRNLEKVASIYEKNIEGFDDKTERLEEARSIIKSIYTNLEMYTAKAIKIFT